MQTKHLCVIGILGQVWNFIVSDPFVSTDGHTDGWMEAITTYPYL